MMMPENDIDLDKLFDAARAEAPRPLASLTARVLADADNCLAVPIVVMPRRRPGILSALAGIFGGGGALAGMMTATVAGLYIGYAQPMETGFVTLVLDGESAEIDMMPGVDALLEEAP